MLTAEKLASIDNDIDTFLQCEHWVHMAMELRTDLLHYMSQPPMIDPGDPNNLPASLVKWVSWGESVADGLKKADAKIAELEKRIADHVCAGPAVTNLVQPQAQTEFEAELRSELQEARQSLQSHRTTVKLQAENNAKLKSEAERDRRELQATLDQKQALVERIGAARACLVLIEISTDEGSVVEHGLPEAIAKVRGIVADGMKETSALKTETGENLLVVLSKVRGDCERAQAESARLLAENEQLRAVQAGRNEEAAPDAARLLERLEAKLLHLQTQCEHMAHPEVRDEVDACLGLIEKYHERTVPE